MIAASRTLDEFARVDVGVATVVHVLDQLWGDLREVGVGGGGGAVDFLEGFMELLAVKGMSAS